MGSASSITAPDFPFDEEIDLPIGRVLVGERLRQVNHHAAEMLAISFAENGQLQAVIVRPAEGEPGYFELVAGAHRHAATRLRASPTIKAVIRELTDAEAELIEVDENLIRRDLSPHERALSMHARLKAWAERFPDRVEGAEDADSKPKRGRPKNSRNVREFFGSTPPTMGFAVETAAAVGLSDDTVSRALSIYRGLTPALHARIANTFIANREGMLRQIAQIADPAEKSKVVELLLAGKAKSVSDAIAIAAGNTPSRTSQSPVDVSLKAYRAVWAKASPSAREAILADLAGRTLPGGWRVEGGR